MPISRFNGVRASELSNRRGLTALRDGEALNGGTPQVWGLSAPIPSPRGREFLRVGELPRSPGVWSLAQCVILPSGQC